MRAHIAATREGGTNMKTKMMSAALVAAMVTTPAMACTDWGAIAAFDAILVANDQKSVEFGCAKGDHPANCAALVLSNPRIIDVTKDRQAALADKCQEDAR
jgi:hypothetical protein